MEKNNQKNIELAAKIADIMYDYDLDEEETSAEIEKLAKRLNEQPDDYFYHVIKSLVEHIDHLEEDL